MEKGKIGTIIIARLNEDEDLFDGIKKRVQESGVKAGAIFAIGALKQLSAGILVGGEYRINDVAGPLEIASCIGNAAVDEKGETAIHAHIVVSNEKGEAFGGHIMPGCKVGVTAELIIIEAVDVTLKRITNPKTKFRMLQLG
jgi:predicted DNA-binding protein with PD1-like motif